MNNLLLEGVDGGSPLGFLAALGAFSCVSRVHPGAHLSWRFQGEYHPVLTLPFPVDLDTAGRRTWLARAIADSLGVPDRPPDQTVLRDLDVREGALDRARKLAQRRFSELKDTRRQLELEGRKSRELSGSSLRQWVLGNPRFLLGERRASRARRVEAGRRQQWLAKLKAAVPTQELRLGKTLSFTRQEFRQLADDLREGATDGGSRELDLIAAFGAEPIESNGRVEPTPFCFVNGSGHQYFLDTVRELRTRVGAARIEKALFFPWSFDDERFSLRWSPLEDRRYALAWGDPSDSAAKTVWAANLLAYEALVFFPAFASSGRLQTPSLRKGRKGDFFVWPLWDAAIGCAAVKSLLSLPDLARECPDRRRLARIGVVAVLESERLVVGKAPNVKINFSPAVPVRG